MGIVHYRLDLCPDMIRDLVEDVLRLSGKALAQ